MPDRQFIERTFFSLLCRRPAEPEIQACQDALDQWRKVAGGESGERALANLVHALLNHNDFVTIR